jgi:hypothetical protein
MATTTTLTKTIGTVVTGWATAIAADAQAGHTAIQTVTNKLSASFEITLARSTGSAYTIGPKVRIEGLYEGSITRTSPQIDAIQMAVGASIANTTLNGAVSAGATSCVVTAGTNIAAGDILFLGHTTTPANYELVRVKSVVTGTTVNFEEACVNAHDSGAQVTDQAEIYSLGPYDLSTFARVRVILDNVGTGQGVYFRCIMNTLDSVATA